jgi:hypothetical protein
MLKFQNNFIEVLNAEGEYIKGKESFKFRKAKILEKDSILNSDYKEFVGKIFDIKYSSNYRNYEDIICIELNGKEIWLEDNEYEFVDELPEYIKLFTKGREWICELNKTKEYYGVPLLRYEDDEDNEYTIKNSQELRIEDILEDSKEYELATKEEYEKVKSALIESEKIELKSKIEYLKEKLQALENFKF